MAITLHLAMTAAEFSNCTQLPDRPAWMACHFSPYGSGLIGLPEALPADSLLILNDRIPPHRHDPALILRQLCDTVEALSCFGVLLDLQRPDCANTRDIAAVLTEGLPCPTAVSEPYARPLSCPVFLNAPPLEQPLEQAVLPWQGRELWMEAALTARRIDITPHGTAVFPAEPALAPEGESFADPRLFCRYIQTVKPDQASFFLYSTAETLQLQAQRAQELGVKRFVGLFQQLH